MKNTVTDKVANRLANISESVTEELVEILVKKELDKRVQQISRAMEKLTDLEKDMHKVSKPDILAYDVEGKPVSSNYSKERLDAKKKAEEAVEKLNSAIDKALLGDMSKLNDLVK